MESSAFPAEAGGEHCVAITVPRKDLDGAVSLFSVHRIGETFQRVFRILRQKLLDYAGMFAGED